MVLLRSSESCVADSARNDLQRQTRPNGFESLFARFICRRRTLRAEDALAAFVVLKGDQYRQYRGHQGRSSARRRRSQVKNKDVVELRRQRCQCKWHELCRKQQQPTEQLNREISLSKALLPAPLGLPCCDANCTPRSQHFDTAYCCLQCRCGCDNPVNTDMR